MTGDTNGTAWDIFTKDLQTGTVERISVSTASVQANGASQNPSSSLNTLYADIALAMCGSLAFGIRAMIEGERFDRALHRVDATYMNLRDMARALVADPSDARI